MVQSEFIVDEIAAQGPFTAPAAPSRLDELRVTFAIPPEVIERARQRLAEAMLAASRSAMELAMVSGRIGALAAQAQPVIIGDPASCPCPICCMRREGQQSAAPWPPSDAEAETSLQEVLQRCTPAEILTVRDELRAGRFEGAASLTCLLGIIAGVRGLTYTQLKLAWGRTAIEEWVIAFVHWGMTQATDPRAALLDAWLTAYLEAHTLEWPAEAPRAPARGVSLADVISNRQRVFRQRVECGTFLNLRE